MAERPVVLYPDRRLKQACAPLAAPTDEKQVQLARDLVDTMRAHPGCVGIAAPQIGELVRMIAIDVSGHKKAVSCHGPLVLLNPRIVESDGSIIMREGCLSIPDLTADVRRPAEVLVEADTFDGRLRLSCDAYECRVLLHELDHLDGLLFLDRVNSARDVYPRKRSNR